MISMINVKCPHCGTEGQINMPPLGAIIVGPCPECESMVAVFCGKVLALEDAIMKQGSLEEKSAHLKYVLQDFIEARIDKLFEAIARQKSQEGEGETSDLAGLVHQDDVDDAVESLFDEADEDIPEFVEPLKPGRELEPQLSAPKISKREFDDFRKIDLNLLDNPDYFRKTFED